ncbi:MAG: hypothetical protein COB24_02725 [Hyphomicrobiales bacterium]|nr:MAG: hypothetical protein COB24_02725 [Hyphomicrobiales bacterium]
MYYDENPFSATSDTPNKDKAAIWDMLVLRDIDAYLAADWSLVENDFIADKFMGIDGKNEQNPSDWKMAFPSLEDYKNLWLEQAVAAQKIEYAEDIRQAIHKLTNLTDIDINQHKAIACKKFHGTIKKADGSVDQLNWQTLYFCEKVADKWKITGFAGYLPYL